ncbi:MAG: hypothetical protein ABC527_06915, partial [Candidatus Methanosuratincola petrocarbonis]
TEEWLERYGFDSFPVVYVGVEDLRRGIDVNKFYKTIAENKMKVIKHNNLDLFFEDNQLIVDYLRKNCPECEIVCVRY